MGKPRYTILLETKARPEDMKVVWEALVAFNRQHVGDDQDQDLVLFVRDNQNNIVGGLLADTFWGWLHISILWLAEDLRGKGYGRDMLTAAEKEAVRRGCHSAFLDTMDWQALEFYQKQGYSIYGELDNFPVGHKRYYLKKTLTELQNK